MWPGLSSFFLPALNALLNALSSIALVAGYFFIRARRISEHRGAMFTAFIFSTVFLVTYITNHALHGDMHFQGQGFVRGVYFPLLISHIALSVVALPMILITSFCRSQGGFRLTGGWRGSRFRSGCMCRLPVSSFTRCWLGAGEGEASRRGRRGRKGDRRT